MKTNELIEKVKHLGLETKCDEHKIEINDKKGITVCLISRKHCFIFTTDYSWETITSHCQPIMID